MQIVVLSPLDLKAGAKGPKGTVEKATLYHSKTSAVLLAEVTYVGGEKEVLAWPSGAGWSVE